ncbi:hypothetical protein SAMD00024442_6_80 [Candidatus Symbiothrix dinenymphae]|nr:hypothetical protein SAMD00024442_6_80 [Candidatus Symbiothrix dinenymphae]
MLVECRKWFAPDEVVPRLNMVWNSIPAQLAKDNKKFVYGVAKEGARARDFELAIQWLVDSGILLKTFRISKPSMPQIAYGAFTEQFVMQQLKAAELNYIGYWTNEKSTNEVDFVVQHKGEITPIEVKAGENLQSKSFKFFCEKYKPQAAFRTSLSDFRQEAWMTNVPLYIIGDYFERRCHCGLGPQ